LAWHIVRSGISLEGRSKCVGAALRLFPQTLGFLHLGIDALANVLAPLARDLAGLSKG
jgi:hypothetical protein